MQIRLVSLKRGFLMKLLSEEIGQVQGVIFSQTSCDCKLSGEIFLWEFLVRIFLKVWLFVKNAMKVMPF